MEDQPMDEFEAKMWRIARADSKPVVKARPVNTKERDALRKELASAKRRAKFLARAYGS